MIEEEEEEEGMGGKTKNRSAPRAENPRQQHQQEEEDPQEEKVAPAEVSMSCGLGPCRPAWLQRRASVLSFTLTLAFAGFATNLSFFEAEETSIDRHFHLSSSQTGAMMVANEVGLLLSVLLVSHFCRKSHVPRVLTVAIAGYGVCAFGIAILNFVYPRSLEDLSSKNISEEDQYLCQGKNHTLYCADGWEEEDDGGGKGRTVVVVLLGMLYALQGVAKATRTPLGITYIDNNVPSKFNTGLYIGIMLAVSAFGPALGYTLAGVLDDIPVDLSDTEIDPDDDRWIGAWWLGFLPPAFLNLLIALLFLCFPRHLQEPQAQEELHHSLEDEAQTDGATAGDHTQAAEVRCGSTESPGAVDRGGVTTDGGLQKQPVVHTDELLEMLRSLFRLLRNPVYVLLVLALSSQVFVLVGAFPFGVEYIHHQFDLDMRLAGYIFGGTALVFNALAIVLGGLLVSRKFRTRRQSLLYKVSVSVVSVVLLGITMAFGCDQHALVGLDGGDVTAGDPVTQCGCDVSQYLPVCDGNTTFFSPCHAGCTEALNDTHFADCPLSVGETLSEGVCWARCGFMAPFLLFYTLLSALRSSCFSPLFVTAIRSVSEQDKTLAVGGISFMISLVGFLPGPKAFGSIVDTTCLVWSVDACSGDEGACAVYDLKELRFRFIGLEMAVSSLTVMLYGLAFAVFLRQVRTGRAHDDKLAQGVEKNKTENELRPEGTARGSRQIAMIRF